MKVENVMLPVMLATLAVTLSACRTVDAGSRVKNNGDVVPQTDAPAVVGIYDADGVLGCSGTVIAANPLRVLTAGHCVFRCSETSATPRMPPELAGEATVIRSDVAPGGAPPAATRPYGDEVSTDPNSCPPAAPGKPRLRAADADAHTVQIAGQLVKPIGIAIHPTFAASASGVHDLAVLTFPAGTPAVAPLDLAAKLAEPGETVRLLGYGVARPDFGTDEDRDGVALLDDACPQTPAEARASVDRETWRMGCAPRETPDERWIKVLDDERETRLRSGTNVVTSVSGGFIRIVGPLTEAAAAGSVTPAQRDSGGPLLDATGALVGTVQSGALVRSGAQTLHEASFVNLLEPSNRAFLDQLRK